MVQAVHATTAVRSLYLPAEHEVHTLGDVALTTEP